MMKPRHHHKQMGELNLHFFKGGEKHKREEDEEDEY